MTRVTFSFIWCDWCDLFWGMGEIEGKDEVSIPRTFSWWQEPWSCHNSSIRRSGSSCEFLPRNAWRNTPSTPSVPKDDKCAEQFKQTNNQIKLAHQPRVQHLAKSKANPTSNHLKTDVRKIVTKHVWQDMVSPAAAVPPPVWSSRFFISRVYRVSFPAKSSNTLSNRKGCVCFFASYLGSLQQSSREILCVLSMLCMLQAPDLWIDFKTPNSSSYKVNLSDIRSCTWLAH